MRGNGLDGHRPRRAIRMRLRPEGILWRRRVGPALEHQCRQDLKVGEERLPLQGLGQHGRKTLLGLLIGEARVGGAQLHVGDEAVEQVGAALDHDEGALLDGARVDGEAHAEGLFECSR